MATLNTTYTGPTALLTGLIAQLTGDTNTEGRDWTLVHDGRNGDGYGPVVLGNSAPDGQAAVYVGFDLRDKEDGIHYAINCRVFKDFSAGGFFYSNPTGSHTLNTQNRHVAGAIALFSGTMKLHCVSNKGRIVLHVCIGTAYFSAYLGRFKQYTLPAEYPYPLLCSCSCYLEVLEGETTYGSHYVGCLHDQTDGMGSIIQPDSRNGETLLKNDYGKRWNNSFCLAGGEWRKLLMLPTEYKGAYELSYPATEPTALLPLMIAERQVLGSNWRVDPVSSSLVYAGDVYGQLDGVYWHPSATNLPESTVTVGADTYRIFPRINNADGNLYYAVKED